MNGETALVVITSCRMLNSPAAAGFSLTIVAFLSIRSGRGAQSGNRRGRHLRRRRRRRVGKMRIEQRDKPR